MTKRASLLVALAAVFAATAAAEREPVLKQIGVPHNYYYREMYLPQAQSGPSAPALTQTVELKVERSGWYTLRASAEHSRAPVLDVYPFATTSPIYVSVAGEPVRHAADARYFVAWIDRLVAAASAHTGWNAPEEREEVLARLQAARQVFVERATP